MSGERALLADELDRAPIVAETTAKGDLLIAIGCLISLASKEKRRGAIIPGVIHFVELLSLSFLLSGGGHDCSVSTDLFAQIKEVVVSVWAVGW